MMLVLRVLKTQPLHGYAIAQRIRPALGRRVERKKASLYPAPRNCWSKAG